MTDEITATKSRNINTGNTTNWSLAPDPTPDYSDWTVVFEWEGDTTTADEQLEDKRRTDRENYKNDDDQQERSTNSTVSYRYAVHRCMLGPKSEYFSRIFRSEQFIESNDRVSTIRFSGNMSKYTFQYVAGEAFQVLLNHCYLNEDEEKWEDAYNHCRACPEGSDYYMRTYLAPHAPGISFMNAPAVLCLCDYFQVESLAEITKRSFLQLISPRNVNDNAGSLTPSVFINIYERTKELRSDFNVEYLETFVVDECLANPIDSLIVPKINDAAVWSGNDGSLLLSSSSS